MAENSNDATSEKCFSGIFQRLLCGGSLPTHPSDQFKEPNTTRFDHSSKTLPFKVDANISSNKVAANSSPGIVARLMGLDSLPEVTKTNHFGTFSRSRSVNSLDYLMQFNLTDQQFHHRRIRTSVSFREIPYSENQEFKSDFLVFCFNNDKEEKKQNYSSNTIRKSNNQEMKPKKVSDCSRKKKNEVSGKQSRIGNKVKKQVKSEEYTTKMSVESKKKRKSKCEVSAKIQPLFNSADSTPIHRQQAATPPVNERKIQLNSRKSQASVANPKHEIISKVEKQKEMSKDTDFYIKVLGETCRLTEEELNESHWIATRTRENFTFEDFEEICLQFGQEILELLVDQVVHELLIFVQ